MSAQQEFSLTLLEHLALPAILIDRFTLEVEEANVACEQTLGKRAQEYRKQHILKLLPGAQRLVEVMETLGKDRPGAFLSGLSIGANNTDISSFNVCLTLVKDGQKQLILLIYFGPSQLHSAPLPWQTVYEVGGHESFLADDVIDGMSRQMNFERWARQMITRLHLSLDRDTVVQSLVDGLGKGMGADRCLFVRTEGELPQVLTHEYALADISPLGLGRTDQLPLPIIEHFQKGPATFVDVADLKQLLRLKDSDLSFFSENAGSSIAGAAVSYQANYFGVVIVLHTQMARRLSGLELEMLNLSCEQAAVALNNCQSFSAIRDQLLKLNLLDNLTQQLTSTLDLVTKSSSSTTERTAVGDPMVPLSYRELEVLKLIASGYANREIAKRLFLTESTVELHASRIRKKLKLKSRTALVKYACDHNLV